MSDIAARAAGAHLGTGQYTSALLILPLLRDVGGTAQVLFVTTKQIEASVLSSGRDITTLLVVRTFIALEAALGVSQPTLRVASDWPLPQTFRVGFAGSTNRFLQSDKGTLSLCGYVTMRMWCRVWGRIRGWQASSRALPILAKVSSSAPPWASCGSCARSWAWDDMVGHTVMLYSLTPQAWQFAFVLIFE